MRWNSKSAFIVSRGVLAIIGLVRTVAIVRLVSLPDYALIGVVESVRSIIGTLFGFGVGDSLSREGAAEQDKKRLGQLLVVSYFNGLALSVPAGLAYIVMALSSEYIYSDPRMPEALAAAFAVSVLERLWLVSLAALQVLDNHRAFVLVGVVYGVVNTLLSIGFVATAGVIGYFYSQIINGALMVTMVLIVIRRATRQFGLLEVAKCWKTTTERLWSVSWFMYVFKGSTMLWRRLPILISAPFVAPQALGAVSAALDFGFKIHLLHQALAPLIIPRLTRAYSESRDRYARLVRREILEVACLNLAVLVVAVLCWRWLGAPVLTLERWEAIGNLFYLALLVEATLVIANISSMCVLVPTKRLGGMTLPTAAMRLATLPAFYLLFAIGLSDGALILSSMLFPGVLVAMFYWVRARSVLQALAL